MAAHRWPPGHCPRAWPETDTYRYAQEHHRRQPNRRGEVSLTLGRHSPVSLFDHLLERAVGLGAQFDGALVVLAGGFLVRRRLRGEDDGEVEVRIGIARVDGRGGLEFLLRGFLPALLARGDAEIIVSRGILRIDGERFREFVDRLVKLALLILDDAQRAMAEVILGR